MSATINGTDVQTLLNASDGLGSVEGNLPTSCPHVPCYCNLYVTAILSVLIYFCRHLGLQTIRPRVDPPRVDPPHVRPKRGQSAPTSGTIRPKFWVVPPRSNCIKSELQ